MNKMFLLIIFSNFLVSIPVTARKADPGPLFDGYVKPEGMASVGDVEMEFLGKERTEYFGHSVASAGDVNGDGYDDILIGARLSDVVSMNEGRVYLYYGGPKMDYVADLIFKGEKESDYFGTAVASAGDVNGDGYSDIIIGAVGNDEGAAEAGKVYIYYGGIVMDTIPDVTIVGKRANDNLGEALASAGDVNGDGYADVIIGIRRDDEVAEDAGKACIYFGGQVMDSTADVIMYGESGDDWFGSSVSSAGDVNGDGYADVIIGAKNSSEAAISAGKAYLFLGGRNMDNTPDLTMLAEAERDKFGSAVSSAGDLNGDGYDDIIISSLNYNNTGENSGKTYIYFGGRNMDNIADLILKGEAEKDTFGKSVAAAGDVNGDGFSDLIIGAPYNSEKGMYAGKVYIYLGGKFVDDIPDHTILGKEELNYFGYCVSSAGDVNGDGYPDILIGAYGYNIRQGSAYLYIRKIDGRVNHAQWTAIGEAVGDVFGYSVSTAGDVNGDGYDDVIIGAYGDDEGGSDAGKAYIYYGGPMADNQADVTMTGEAANDYFGLSVSAAGDVNGDGYDDVIVGAYGNDEADSSAGKAYIYYGGPAMDNLADVTMIGEAARNSFGFSVSAAGDVNGDGYDDVIIGADGNDEGGSSAGKVYIYYGGPEMDNLADVTMAGEAVNNAFGRSVSKAGDVNGDGYDDVVIGAYGNSEGGFFAGKAYIYYGGPAMDNLADVTMIGEASSDYFGRSVSEAGDVNGDGYDDVIIGAYGNDEGGSIAGKAYIYYGGPAMDNLADVTMIGEAARDYYGYSVSKAGDVNGDGYDDVIIGAHENDERGVTAGKAYVYYGGFAMDSRADVTMTGEAAGDYFTQSVSLAGDVNGDGYDDVIIGASGNDEGGTQAGKAYIFYSNGRRVEPNVFYAQDVPADQGGYVMIKWSKSSLDTKPVSKITHYVVQRSPRNPAPLAWENLIEIPASRQMYYGYTAATQYDSVSSNPAIFLYRVVAKTDNHNDIWISNVVRAYSVDNLAPSPSESLLAKRGNGVVKLSWQPNKTDRDFSHFAVYKSTTEDFQPAEQFLLGTTTDTVFTDNAPESGEINYYRVVSFDVHENPSRPSPLAFVDLTSLEDERGELIPKQFALKQNYPNPFNPATTISYDLPKAGRVQLILYNSLGQTVKTLLDKHQPAGRYSVQAEMKRLASGVYIYALFHNGVFIQTRKMILLR